MARVPDLERLLRRARPEDDHGRRPDRLPAAARQAGRAGRQHARCRPRFGEFNVFGYRALLDDKHHVAMVKGEVAGGARRARARALGVPDRRRLPLAALRLRRAARVGAGDDRARGPRACSSTSPRRAAGSGCSTSCKAYRLQDEGLDTVDANLELGLPGRPARLRHRRADPRRSRAEPHPHPHQQPEEDPRPGGLRPLGHRAGADRARRQPAQRALPARQARAPRPHPAPPGARARRGDGPRRARARPRRRRPASGRCAPAGGEAA